MANAAELWQEILAPGFDSEKNWNKVETVLEAAKISDIKAKVNFGTSGWRGEIGSEFTVKNVQVVGKAIVKLYQNADAEMWEALGINSFEELQKRGLVIGHDNRFLGKEFCEAVADQFIKAGVKVYFGGQTSTPEFSAVAEMMGCAAAVNMTPSHNPANYAGIKFNPADGGPAGPEITSVITKLANEIMIDHVFEEIPAKLSWEKLDTLTVYEEYLYKKKTIDFEKVFALLDSGKISVVLDHVHGATRGRPNQLLKNASCIEYLRTEDNQLFGGIAPEPSTANLAGIREALAKKTTPLKLGAIFDPDGDRIRFHDGEVEIPMNAFGALAFHYMAAHKKLNGCLAKSVATSNFANIIAEKMGIEIAETAVGFKNFRPYMKSDANPRALVAFEESDGISGYNNTLEKDAEFGLLLALEAMAVTGKNLGEYLEDLYAEFGRLYPERAAFEVDKSLVGAPLIAKVNSIADKAPVGSKVKIGDVEKVVKAQLTLDGVKVIFEDDSWMLVRPSGTEPKVRIYTECRDENEKEAMFEAAKGLFYND